MFQLAYISSSKTPVDRAMLDDILAVSRRNNARAGITGLLVAGGRRFLQVLEGPEQAVLTTYTRIGRDDRHRGLVMISAKAVEWRAFGEWSMAFRDSGAASGDELEDLVAKLVGTIEDPNLRAQFTGFAKLHNRAA